ncbi:neuropeptides capa receptor-like isoform X2 [Saccostrea cucullata]
MEWHTAMDNETFLENETEPNYSCNASNCFPRGTMNNTQSIYRFLQVYVLPVIVFSGLIGNTLSACAFLVKELRRISSTVYVIAVLTADNGVLISLLFVWLEVLGFRFNHEEGMCQFQVYWSYICTFLSIWFVVCITVENYITICHPTRITSMCTVRRAVITTTSLLGFALSFYSVFIVTTTVNVHSFGERLVKMCEIGSKFTKLVVLFVNADTAITFIIPLVLIMFMLIAISLSVIKSVQLKKKRCLNQKNSNNNRAKSIPQVRVAKMLYILSLTFVILSVPSHALRTYISFGPDSLKVSEQIILIHAVLQFVYYTNFSIKFILFACCSKNFRKSLLLAMNCRHQSYTPVSSSGSSRCQ